MLRASLAPCLIALTLAACTDPASVQKQVTPVPPSSATTETKPSIPPGKITAITFEQFYLLQQNDQALICDARRSIFYCHSHIPGAINIPHGSQIWDTRKFEPQFKNAVAQKKAIVTYCSSETCPDATRLAKQISSLGYPVKIFQSGWETWTKAEMPTQSTNP